MKKYLSFAMVALALTACQNDIEGPAQRGELEQSYVAISLAADGMSTRASDGTYEDGTANERKVTSAYVFFFDNNGSPFIVNKESRMNYIAAYDEFAAEESETPVDNVSDIQQAVLVIENRKGEHPTQMVAVLNWVPTHSYTLSDLQTTLADLGNETNGFVMSNAVYRQNDAEMAAATITPDHIATTPEAAKANPVEIYVERLAAKVTFDAANDGLFEVGSLNESSADADKVYAQITGWELYKDYDKSTYVKDIDPTWTDDYLGFNWNDASWNRSYWAQSPNTAPFASTTFEWASTNNLPLSGHFYCGENTNRDEADRTKVIIKAQLKKKNADNTYSDIELSRWYATDYIGEEALKTAVANTLAHSIYSGVTAGGTTTYTSIKPSDLKVVEANEAPTGTDIKAFEVFFQLSDVEGMSKTWYQYADGAYTPSSTADINARLAAVEPALRYTKGQTYYYTDIKHLGREGKKGEFGVVRNHVYKFNITAINGYGTPVFDGDTDFVTPERPEDIETFVAAEIKILSWRVVEQDQTLH